MAQALLDHVDDVCARAHPRPRTRARACARPRECLRPSRLAQELLDLVHEGREEEEEGQRLRVRVCARACSCCCNGRQYSGSSILV